MLPAQRSSRNPPGCYVDLLAVRDQYSTGEGWCQASGCSVRLSTSLCALPISTLPCPPERMLPWGSHEQSPTSPESSCSFDNLNLVVVVEHLLLRVLVAVVIVPGTSILARVRNSPRSPSPCADEPCILDGGGLGYGVLNELRELVKLGRRDGGDRILIIEGDVISPYPSWVRSRVCVTGSSSSRSPCPRPRSEYRP